MWIWRAAETATVTLFYSLKRRTASTSGVKCNPVLSQRDESVESTIVSVPPKKWQNSLLAEQSSDLTTGEHREARVGSPGPALLGLGTTFPRGLWGSERRDRLQSCSLQARSGCLGEGRGLSQPVRESLVTAAEAAALE